MRFGFDEVGRGCLAGPVTICIAGIPHEWPRYTFAHSPDQWSNRMPEWLKKARDSKKMSEKIRDDVSMQILQEPKIFSQLLSASAELIDEWGIGVILSHLLWLSVQIVAQKNRDVSEYIADGQITIIKTPNTQLLARICQENNLQIWDKMHWVKIANIVQRENKADDCYLAVALASTVAKVWRDTEMKKLGIDFPQYGWEQNKGYGTLAHRAAITAFGVISLHRKSWIHGL